MYYYLYSNKRGIIIINCDNSAAINIIESDKNVNGVKSLELVF